MEARTTAPRRAVSPSEDTRAQTTDRIVSSPTGAEELVGRYREYADAQRAVDALSDAGFPVGSVRIVGRDVSIVEQVTGRMTTARATGLGAVSGAWFGLFVGHAATGGQRDVSSVRGLAAGSHDVLTDAGLGERARAVLGGAAA